MLAVVIISVVIRFGFVGVVVVRVVDVVVVLVVDIVLGFVFAVVFV